MENDKKISPGSIGAKIKKIRELRNMTQKELGECCGFMSGSAKSRISQYESDVKTPKSDAVKKIADVLDVDETYFSYTDHADFGAMVHALFDMEDIYDLHPYREKDGTITLHFDDQYKTVTDNYPTNIKRFLENWTDALDAYNSSFYNSTDHESQKKSEDDYALWKASYLHHASAYRDEELEDEQELERLKRQIAEVEARIAERKKKTGKGQQEEPKAADQG